MTWFKVDDTLAMHSKARAAGLPAMGLWTLAGSWAAQQGTDGRIPRHMLPALGATKAQADKLVSAGLWDTDDQGYVFHDWLDYQPTAAEVRADKAAKHEAKSAAGRAGGIASGIARRRNSEAKRQAGHQADVKQLPKQVGNG